MSSVTIQLTNICSGGSHLTFSVTGDATLSSVLDISSISEPIDEQDIDAFLRVVVRMAKRGRTVAQARTLLQEGVEISV